jgi:hypothetical protein
MLGILGRSGKFFWTIRSGTFSLLTIAAIICLLSGCSRAQQLPENRQPLAGEKKVLIVYLSRTNNTRAIAEFIHQKVGGTLIALELETPYPADYNATVQQVERENETGAQGHADRRTGLRTGLQGVSRRWPCRRAKVR